MVLSPPNTNQKVSVIRNNVNINAAGTDVAVTLWTNETGTLNPVIRTSTDGGNTFGNLIRLNSTSGEVHSPSNMTGAAGNTTGGSHGSSIHTTNPAAVRHKERLQLTGYRIGRMLDSHKNSCWLWFQIYRKVILGA